MILTSCKTGAGTGRDGIDEVSGMRGGEQNWHHLTRPPFNGPQSFDWVSTDSGVFNLQTAPLQRFST